MSELLVSSSPHIRSRVTTRRLMLDVIIALLPCLIAGIVFFGWYALALAAISVGGAVATEFVYALVYRKCWKDFKGAVRHIVKDFDFTSVISGLILALIVPVGVEWYLPLLGSIFAIALCKMLFGGTGRNLVNPADAARVFLFISFSSMTAYVGTCIVPALVTPNADVSEILSGATPLTALFVKNGGVTLSPGDLFLGTGVDGCIGETCKLAILVGFLWLIVRRVIKWYYPLIYIGVTGLFAVALQGFDFNYFLPSILSGGLVFGAVFMATDYSTSPKSTAANVVYFVCLGLLTAGLRKATGIEVVSFCILLMNCLTPLLDRYLPRRPFGYVHEKRAKKINEATAAKEGKA